VNSDKEMLMSLPSYLEALVPHKILGENLQYKKDDLEHELGLVKYGLVEELNIIGGASFSSPDVQGIIRDFPMLALHVAAGEFAETEWYKDLHDRLLEKDGSDKLLEFVQRSPKCIIDCVHVWATLFRLPNGVGEHIRSLAVGAAASKVATGAYRRRTTPFQLLLPKEASFLPHILVALIDILFGPRYRFFIRPDDKLNKREVLEQWICEYVPDPSTLKDIMTELSCCAEVRGAAALMYLLHSGGEKSTKQLAINLLPEMYELGTGDWFPFYAAETLHESVCKKIDLSLAAVGKLIQLSRNNFTARLALEKKISEWREISYAPVQRYDRPELWR
jgi:hypothetical protein